MTNLEQIFVAITAIATSGTIWKVVSERMKLKIEQRNKELENSDSTLYREDMKQRLEKMALDLEEANNKILQLIEEVSILKTENKYLKREIDRLKDK